MRVDVSPALVDIVRVGDSMFTAKCPLRRDSLPILPCDCKECDWYVYSAGNNNCFWVLCEHLVLGEEKSFEEIASMLNMEVDEVTTTYEQALGTIRRDPERMRALEEVLKAMTEQANEETNPYES